MPPKRFLKKGNKRSTGKTGGAWLSRALFFESTSSGPSLPTNVDLGAKDASERVSESSADEIRLRVIRVAAALGLLVAAVLGMLILAYNAVKTTDLALPARKATLRESLTSVAGENLTSVRQNLLHFKVLDEPLFHKPVDMQQGCWGYDVAGNCQGMTQQGAAANGTANGTSSHATHSPAPKPIEIHEALALHSSHAHTHGLLAPLAGGLTDYRTLLSSPSWMERIGSIQKDAGSLAQRFQSTEMLPARMAPTPEAQVLDAQTVFDLHARRDQDLLDVTAHDLLYKRRRWAGVHIDGKRMMWMLENVLAKWKSEWFVFETLEHQAKSKPRPAWAYAPNSMFSVQDARVLHAMLRHFKPATVLEIGAGYSTRVGVAALLINTLEGFEGKYIIVEPFPARVPQQMPGATICVYTTICGPSTMYCTRTTCSAIYVGPLTINISGAWTLVQSFVETLPLEQFLRLKRNDVLFIDSSHLIGISCMFI